MFDENGKYLDQWPNIRQPFHLMVSADQFLWVVDGATNRFLKYDLNGKLLLIVGHLGHLPGRSGACTSSPLMRTGICTQAGTYGGRTQKFAEPGPTDRR